MEQIRREILAAAKDALQEGASWAQLNLKELGFEEAQIQLAFKRGVLDLVLFQLAAGDASLQNAEGESGKIREKIANLIWQRLSYDDRAMAQKTARFLSLHGAAGARALWRSSDAIWQNTIKGDSTFSYYSKRALLSVIYAKSLLFYLSPQGEEDSAVKKFIAREIDGLLKTMTFFKSAPQAKPKEQANG